MEHTTEFAYAKINLSLDILGKLPNGYHEVQTVMQSLTLHDTVTLKKNTSGAISLSCSNPALPTDKRNLAYRAAAAFLEHFRISSGISIQLEKQIPCAAGLAGGSSDAAAVLRGCNRLFDINAPFEELAGLGTALGADIPYCLFLGTALCEGIGERLTRLPDAPDCHCVLVKPDAGASTGEIYQAYDALEAEGGIRHPQTALLLNALEQGDFLLLCSNLCNVLEPVTRTLLPEISVLIEKMRALGADGVRMSGSGPTVFGLFSDASRAHAAAEAFWADGIQECFLTDFFHDLKKK